MTGSAGQSFGAFALLGMRLTLIGAAALAVGVYAASDLNMLHALLASHTRRTGSRLARAILRRDRHLSGFHRLAPRAVEGSAALGAGKAVNE